MELKYFNIGHILMILLSVAVFCAIYFPLKNKPEEKRNKILYIILLLNVVLCIIYKGAMAFRIDGKLTLNELPLHMCNINVVLLPIAFKTKNKYLLSYIYYVGSLAALSGILFFDAIFLNESIFSFVVLSCMIYHAALFATGILLPIFKLYNPSKIDILKSAATLIVLTVTFHLVNVIFRETGASLDSNFFYTFGMEGNPILGGLYKLIPVPIVYQFPILPALFAINYVMWLPFRRREKGIK